MSDKEQRVAVLNADLQAGRVKVLEREPGAWYREYLGEWCDAPRIHAARCEPCGLAFTGATASEANYHAAAHHTVCPKRPIEVGDLVEWDNKYNERWHAADPRWFRGVVDGTYHGGCSVRIESGSEHYSAGGRVPYCNVENIRRIPRPAEAQAAVPTCCGQTMRTTGMGATPALPAYLCATCERYEQGGIRTAGPYWRRDPAGGSQWAVASERAQYEHGRRNEQPPPCAPGCQCGAHATAATRIERRDEVIKERYTEPPAPALVDGLTRAQCLERFHKAQREHLHRTYASLWLTPEQLTAAREEWSAALRARIDASRKAERSRVTYCEVDADD